MGPARRCVLSAPSVGTTKVPTVSAAVTPERNSPVLYNQENHRVVNGLRFYRQVENREAQHLLSPFSEDSKNPVRQYRHLASKGGYNDELTTVTSVADGDSGCV